MRCSAKQGQTELLTQRGDGLGENVVREVLGEVGDTSNFHDRHFVEEAHLRDEAMSVIEFIDCPTNCIGQLALRLDSDRIDVDAAVDVLESNMISVSSLVRHFAQAPGSGGTCIVPDARYFFLFYTPIFYSCQAVKITEKAYLICFFI